MIELNNVQYMTEKEAVKRYGYSSAWFQKQRTNREPPSYVKLKGKTKGRVYYPLLETDKWFKDNLEKYCATDN